MDASYPLVYLSGLIVLFVLLVCYRMFGGTFNLAKLIMGADGRASSSKLQFLLWTIVTIYAYVAVYAARLAQHIYLLPEDEIPVQLLTAMGLSVVTAAAAKGITVGYTAAGRLEKQTPPGVPPKGGVFLDDGGNPDLSKIQMLCWTFIAIGVYLVTLFSKLSCMLHLSPQDLAVVHGAVAKNAVALVTIPDISPALMVLMGLGQGAYLGNKLVTVETPRLTGLVPGAGIPGSSLTLSGEAFGPAGSQAQVTIDGAPLEQPIAVTDGKLAFTFPPRRADGSPWPAGPVSIGVLAQGRAGANTLPFTVLLPQITKIEPSEGKPPLKVVITATNFDEKAAPPVVFVDSQEYQAAGQVTVKEGGQLEFAFPSQRPDGGAWTSGTVQIRLRANGYLSGNSWPFVIKA
jgi:hypothetical protein